MRSLSSMDQRVLLVTLLAGALASALALPDKPNIIFILADDMDLGLLQYMPNVQQMQAEGVTFTSYYVTDSLCCPSRSSIFTGNYPHTTGVFTNEGNDGGYDAYNANGNEANSFVEILKQQGYNTSMMGKYLNGYKTSDAAAPGWASWAVADKGYDEFNYDLNQNGKIIKYGKQPQDYLTDVLNTMAVGIVQQAGSSPFMMEVATFAPHHPYTPAPRDANLFPGLTAPRPPSFNATSINPVAWLAAIPPLTDSLVQQIDQAFRLRAQSVVSVDKLVGDVRAAVAAAGLENSTYVIFSSDNGYHLGQHRQSWGKQTAFTYDIHVPLIVVGPGIAPNTSVAEITQNTDLCPTFAELAGAPAPPRDGVSLVPFLTGQTVANWRTVALIEHHGPNNGPGTNGTDPDMEPGGASNFADPTTYEALRGADFVYVEYDTGEFQFHNLTTDADELNNTYASLPAAQQSALAAQLATAKACKGGACLSNSTSAASKSSAVAPPPWTLSLVGRAVPPVVRRAFAFVFVCSLFLAGLAALW